MKTITTLTAVLSIMIALFGLALANNAEAALGPPKVEVVFCLDTTGSMTGLIEGAKQKIWGIANQIITGEPKPAIRIGLVGYRDYEDAYVTKIFQLDDDLDAVFENLMGFRADGGGDTPEHVNKAVYDAVHSINWSNDGDTLKVVFLVGDCPPHMDYDDGYDYRTVCREAVTQDIIINTVQCGDSGDTVRFWKDIARRGEGRYAKISQSGGMQHMDTPYDEELVSLSSKLESTVVAFGSAAELEKAEKRSRMVSEMAPEAACDRAAYKSRDGKIGEYDLIDAVGSGAVTIEELSDDEIPGEMRGMSSIDKKRYLENKQKERTSIMSQIEKLTVKRSEYITDRIKSAESQDSFDETVKQIIAGQAKAKGISY
ncbi:MAG: VWA domain-containing protein [Spirochaetes bacterium]|nr:VWA domain-containing protein [Spirochaetota bacterium]